MELPLSIRKERNKQITKMLKDKCGIIVKDISLSELKEHEEGFIVTKYGVITIIKTNKLED